MACQEKTPTLIRSRSRPAGDAVQCIHHFGEKLVAQSRRFVIVELDYVVQFDFRNLEKSNSHLFVFGQDFFEGDGFRFSFLISVEPALRFHGPQLSDRFVGLIQARQQTINQVRLFKRIQG